MPVCQNKVLVVEIWVKTQFLPPFNGYKAKLQKYLLWFSDASIPHDYMCEVWKKNKTLVWVGLEQPPFYCVASP